MSDDVMKEIHAIKDANARRFGGNLEALVRDAQKRQAKSGRVIVHAARRRTPRRLRSTVRSQ